MFNLTPHVHNRSMEHAWCGMLQHVCTCRWKTGVWRWILVIPTPLPHPTVRQQFSTLSLWVFYKSNDELLLVMLRAACVNNNSSSKTKCSKTYKESFKTNVGLVLFCLQTTNTRSIPWTLCHLRHRGGGGYSLRNWCWLVSINCAVTSTTTIDKAMFGILERQKNGFRWRGSNGDLRCRHKHR